MIHRYPRVLGQKKVDLNKVHHAFLLLLSVVAGVLLIFFSSAEVIGNSSQDGANQTGKTKTGKVGAPLPERAARLSPEKRSEALYVSGAVSGDRVLLVGERGLILLSKDGGDRYAQIDAPTRRLLSDVILREDGVAIAVGHESTVLRSTDFGESWQVVHHDPDQDLALFSVIDSGAGKIVAVGAFGLVLTSSDDGMTWEQGLISEDGPHLYSVKKTDDALVTVGEFGSLYKSQDDGKSWTLLPTPYEGTLFDILVKGDQWILMGLQR